MKWLDGEARLQGIVFRASKEKKKSVIFHDERRSARSGFTKLRRAEGGLFWKRTLVSQCVTRKLHRRRTIENIWLLMNRQASQSTFHIVKILDGGAQKRKAVFFLSVPQSLAFAKLRIFLFQLRLTPVWDLKVGWNFYVPHLIQFGGRLWVVDRPFRHPLYI